MFMNYMVSSCKMKLVVVSDIYHNLNRISVQKYVIVNCLSPFLKNESFFWFLLELLVNKEIIYVI